MSSNFCKTGSCWRCRRSLPPQPQQSVNKGKKYLRASDEYRKREREGGGVVLQGSPSHTSPKLKFLLIPLLNASVNRERIKVTINNAESEMSEGVDG